MNSNTNNKLGNVTPGNTIKAGYEKTRNTAARAYQGFQGSSVLVKIIISILVISVIIMALIWIWYAYAKGQQKSLSEPFFITSPVNAWDPKLAKKSWTIPDPSEGLAFSHSFWIYIHDWNYRFGQWKNIFLVGNQDRRIPGLWLYPKTNSLHARISTYADPNEGCDIQNIPLQKWVHIAYILNNRTVDIYIDGKLERSCVLRGVPHYQHNSKLRIAQGGGFYGQIAKFQYFNRAMDPHEVSEIYAQGPYAATKYNVRFFEDGKFVQFNQQPGIKNDMSS